MVQFRPDQIAPASATMLYCSSYGVPFCVQSSKAGRLLHVLPHNTVLLPELPPETATFSLPAASPGDPFPEDRVRAELMVHVANFAPDHVFLHAGVVAWQGRGLVLPGQSFAGKSTLVAALVRAGCHYYSDEYAVIGATGLVHPFDRNLQLRVPGSPAQTATPVASLGGRAGAEPLKIALAAFLQYDPAASWEPRTMSAGMAVLEMLRHCIPVQRTPARVLHALTAMVADAEAIECSRPEAAATAQALMRRLEDL